VTGHDANPRSHIIISFFPLTYPQPTCPTKDGVYAGGAKCSLTPNLNSRYARIRCYRSASLSMMVNAGPENMTLQGLLSSVNN